MQLKPSSLIIVAAACVAAVPLWTAAHSGPRPSPRPLAAPESGDIELSGELIPAITAFIDARDVELKIPPGTPVNRGDVIGIALVEDESEEQVAARQELEAASAAWRLARAQSRHTQAELATLEDEAAALNRQEFQSQVAAPAADSQLAIRCSLLGPGASAQCDELSADFARARLSRSAIEADELEARAEAERGELRDATERVAAARAGVENTPSGPRTVAIVAPADGVLVAIDGPEGRKLGIASGPAQLPVHAIAHSCDLERLRIGSAATVIVQSLSGSTLVAHVTAISTTPVDDSNGADYQVTLAADNAGRIWLDGGRLIRHRRP